MLVYIKFLADGYVKEFTTALEAKEHLNRCGEGEEKFYILSSREPIEDKEFKGFAFSVFEKDQVEKARAKIDNEFFNSEGTEEENEDEDEEL